MNLISAFLLVDKNTVKLQIPMTHDLKKYKIKGFCMFDTAQFNQKCFTCFGLVHVDTKVFKRKKNENAGNRRRVASSVDFLYANYLQL